MTNNQMTVKLWAEIDDNQAENLNGGYLNIYIAGGVGAVQQNAGDGTQLNLVPIGKGPKNYFLFF